MLGSAPIFDHHDLVLRPDPARTVVRPFQLDYPSAFQVEGHSRAEAIVARVLTLDDAMLARELELVTASLDDRHRDVDAMLLRRYDAVAATLPGRPDIDANRRRLIGAYFSEEFSYEAAALFNPSAVLAPDQSGAPEGGGALRAVVARDRRGACVFGRVPHRKLGARGCTDR